MFSQFSGCGLRGLALCSWQSGAKTMPRRYAPSPVVRPCRRSPTAKRIPACPVMLLIKSDNAQCGFNVENKFQDDKDLGGKRRAKGSGCLERRFVTLECCVGCRGTRPAYRAACKLLEEWELRLPTLALLQGVFLSAAAVYYSIPARTRRDDHENRHRVMLGQFSSASAVSWAAKQQQFPQRHAAALTALSPSPPGTSSTSSALALKSSSPISPFHPFSTR